MIPSWDGLQTSLWLEGNSESEEATAKPPQFRHQGVKNKHSAFRSEYLKSQKIRVRFVLLLSWAHDRTTLDSVRQPLLLTVKIASVVW